MTRKLVAYLAHPVGHDPVQREKNIANTRAWLRFLVDHTDYAISVPWLPYVCELEEELYRDRGIADDLASLERCDIVILCGGRVSPGMAAEADHAHRHGIPVVDLTGYGYTPPPLDDARARSGIAFRVGKAIGARARRVWLPPLDEGTIQNLKIAAGAVFGLADRAGVEDSPYADAIEALRMIIAHAEARPA